MNPHGNLERILKSAVVVSWPGPAGTAPDFSAYGTRQRRRFGGDRPCLQPFVFITGIVGGCLKVCTIYFPKLLSGGRDAGLFVAGQC